MGIGGQAARDGSGGLLGEVTRFFRMSHGTAGIADESHRLRVGVVGYSGQKFDEEKAGKFLDEAFGIIAKRYPQREVRMVSGWTNLGIPKLAYERAVERGWQTEGISTMKAFEFERFDVDVWRIVGDDWGAESPAFLHSIDVLIRVGGGGQALREAEAAKRLNLPILEYDLPALKG